MFEYFKVTCESSCVLSNEAKNTFRKVSANGEVRLQTSYQKTKKEKVVSLNWIVLFKD